MRAAGLIPRRKLSSPPSEGCFIAARGPFPARLIACPHIHVALASLIRSQSETSARSEPASQGAPGRYMVTRVGLARCTDRLRYYQPPGSTTVRQIQALNPSETARARQRVQRELQTATTIEVTTIEKATTAIPTQCCGRAGTTTSNAAVHRPPLIHPKRDTDSESEAVQRELHGPPPPTQRPSPKPKAIPAQAGSVCHRFECGCPTFISPPSNLPRARQQRERDQRGSESCAYRHLH